MFALQQLETTEERCFLFGVTVQNRQLPAGKNMSREADNTVGIRQQATTDEDTTDLKDLVCHVICEV
jgi:hypothetical protein